MAVLANIFTGISSVHSASFSLLQSSRNSSSGLPSSGWVAPTFKSTSNSVLCFLAMCDVNDERTLYDLKHPSDGQTILKFGS